ncbi:MAG: addiction module protein [Longimicrobiales bacterium]
MGRPLEKIESEVLGLSVPERARLAKLLIASLDHEPLEDPIEVDKAWEQEIYQRLEQIQSGKVELIPAEEVFEELRRRHRK